MNDDYAPEMQDPGDGDMFGAFADAVKRAHVHDYQPVIDRPARPPYWETLRGYRCACGEWRPFPSSIFDRVANVRAALKRYREAGPSRPADWTPDTEEPE